MVPVLIEEIENPPRPERWGMRELDDRHAQGDGAFPLAALAAFGWDPMVGQT
ncbi:MAG: hypothetical protein WC654_01475 [Patescibacteria group bacterium]